MRGDERFRELGLLFWKRRGMGDGVVNSAFAIRFGDLKALPPLSGCLFGTRLA